jgi:hypothetical protein
MLITNVLLCEAGKATKLTSIETIISQSHTFITSAKSVDSDPMHFLQEHSFPVMPL